MAERWFFSSGCSARSPGPSNGVPFGYAESNSATTASPVGNDDRGGAVIRFLRASLIGPSAKAGDEGFAARFAPAARTGPQWRHWYGPMASARLSDSAGSVDRSLAV